MRRIHYLCIYETESIDLFLQKPYTVLSHVAVVGKTMAAPVTLTVSE